MRDSIVCCSRSFVSSSSHLRLIPSCKLYAGLESEIPSSPCSALLSTKGRNATSRLLSPDLHLGGSQRVRVPEYAAPQPSSSSRRHRPRQPPHCTSQPSTRPPRHDTALAFTLDDAALACIPSYDHAASSIILIQPVSASADPHPGTLSTLIRFSQLRGNASCLSQPPILDSPTPALGHLQPLCFSHHHTRSRRRGLLL